MNVRNLNTSELTSITGGSEHSDSVWTVIGYIIGGLYKGSKTRSFDEYY